MTTTSTPTTSTTATATVAVVFSNHCFEFSAPRDLSSRLTPSEVDQILEGLPRDGSDPQDPREGLVAFVCLFYDVEGRGILLLLSLRHIFWIFGGFRSVSLNVGCKGFQRKKTSH